MSYKFYPSNSQYRSWPEGVPERFQDGGDTDIVFTTACALTGTGAIAGESDAVFTTTATLTAA